MCGICGCGEPAGQTKLKPVTGRPRYVFNPASGYHTGIPAAELNSSGQKRLLNIDQDLFAKNDIYAAQNRSFFRQHQILVLNLLSSPGAGKTTLLVETIKRMQDRIAIAVIEGDQHTERDAERIRVAGVKALQINTGRLCHLEADMIGKAVTQLNIEDRSLLFIENIGNLVCPSAFDLGESYKVVILSVTEGDDKPLKYPDMFHAADLLIINKTDLLPYVDFDVANCEEFARRVNPNIKIIRLSSTNHENFKAWTDWLSAGIETD
ncbi:MAG: hydrogenase nickel incorporation protein HypB [Gammaproteobacteria bacterium]|nr:hydrogenase nickel incorporation protein HypB [Gammaproteobacteria bacterium]